MRPNEHMTPPSLDGTKSLGPMIAHDTATTTESPRAAACQHCCSVAAFDVEYGVGEWNGSNGISSFDGRVGSAGSYPTALNEPVTTTRRTPLRKEASSTCWVPRTFVSKMARLCSPSPSTVETRAPV